MSRANGDQIREYKGAYAELRRQLGATGFLWVGTVLHQYQVCGKPSCRCRKENRFRHGPYYVWTRKVRGKTVTRMLTEAEGRLYTEWIHNRRTLNKTIKKMMSFSKRLAPLLLRRTATR
jgi:hypothetical protein